MTSVTLDGVHFAAAAGAVQGLFLAGALLAQRSNQTAVAAQLSLARVSVEYGVARVSSFSMKVGVSKHI